MDGSRHFVDAATFVLSRFNVFFYNIHAFHDSTVFAWYHLGHFTGFALVVTGNDNHAVTLADVEFR